MKGEAYKVEQYILTLTEDEAKWLKSICQNSIDVEFESPDDARIRESFFNLLKLLGV